MEQLREGYARSREQRTNALPSPYPWRARLECPRGHKRNRTKRAQSEFRLARDYHVVLNPELQAFLVHVGLRKRSRPSVAMSQRLDELRSNRMSGPRILTSDELAIGDHMGLEINRPVDHLAASRLECVRMLQYIFA